MDFEEEADDYCVDVSALDIVTLDTHEYPELHRCVAAGDVQLGSAPVELDDAFLANENCLQPPDGHVEQWCSANANVCEAGVDERCKRFRYACEEGPLPDEWRASAALVPERNIPLRDPPSNESCSASTPGARSTTGSFVYLMLLALLLRRASAAAR